MVILNGYIFPILIRCCGAGKSSQKFYFLLLLWVFWGWRVLVPFWGWLRMAGAAPHTPFPAFFFLGVCWFPFWGCSGMAGAAPHTLFLAFFFLACAAPPFPAAPHTLFLAFSFLTCTVGRLRDGRCRSAHVISCFFLFDVCSTSLPSRSAHAISLFFLFDVCSTSLPCRSRTRHFPFLRLLFPFIHFYSHFFFFTLDNR